MKRLHQLRRDPFAVIGVTVAMFLSVMVALFMPEKAIIPAVLLGVLTWWVTRKEYRDAPRPCQQCGRRFRGADMVEHHVNEHRECAS